MKRIFIVLVLLSAAALSSAAGPSYYEDHILFSLHKDEAPLTRQACETLETPYPALNAYIKKHGVVRIEPWLPRARPGDRDGDVYLNRIYRLVLSRNTEASLMIMAELANSAPAITGVEREPLMKKYAVPNDPSLGNQWHLSKVQARQAWQLWDLEGGETPGDPQIVIAVVDDGVEYTHPDLWKNIWINQDEIPSVYFSLIDDTYGNSDGYVTAEEAVNFCGDIDGNGKTDLRDVIAANSLLVSNTDTDGDGYKDNIIGWDTDESSSDSDDDRDPMVTDNSHGTHVAGLAGAVTNNGIGIASVGYSVSVMPVKATGDAASDNISTGWDGILYAAHAGADIINCSWGGPGYSSYAQNIINSVYNTYGAIVVAAAGNGDDSGNPTDEPHYPSGYQNVVSVTALNSSDIFSWANYGAPDPANNFYGVDIAAPGESIYSTYLTKVNSYASLSGTSMASPLVASCLGLIKSVYPDSTNDWLVSRLLEHTDPIDALNPDYAGQLGSGRVNILKSLVYDTWPKISYVSHAGTITGGDADSVLNPGESFRFLIELKNDTGWADAQNVQGILRTAREGIVILDSTGAWTQIPQNTAALNSDDGFSVAFSADLLPANYAFTLELTANASGEYPYTVSIPIQLSLFLDQQGFPFIASTSVEASPVFADIDGNGTQEIIFGDKSGMLYVVDYSGSVLPGFPVSLGSQTGGVAVADIDRDGVLEIVATLFDRQVRVYDINGQFEWSRRIDGFITAMPAIGNVDADPEYEVVFGAYDQKLYVMNHDSSDVSGFPRNIGKNIRGGVALADVNADGYDEIVYGEYGGQVSILDVQGNTLSGWPKTTSGSISGEPCVIVTGDHDAIILIGNDQGDMYGYDLNGTQRFMIDGYGSIKASPALLREGDAIYAAFGASSGELYLIDVMNGTLLPDWPKTIGPVYQSLAFADVVNDTEETQQVLAVGNDGLIYAFTKQGQNVPGFPVNIRYLSKSSLAFADIDNDGDNEIICGTYSGISVIDLKEGLGGSYWPLHRGNRERSGAIFTMVSAVKETDLPVEFEFELIGNAPNPFNPLTMIKYTVSDSAPVVLRIYSLDGKQIMEKEIREPSAGTNLIPIDMSGFSSGLYLYSLEHNKVVKKAKMIYLK